VDGVLNSSRVRAPTSPLCCCNEDPTVIITNTGTGALARLIVLQASGSNIAAAANGSMAQWLSHQAGVETITVLGCGKVERQVCHRFLYRGPKAWRFLCLEAHRGTLLVCSGICYVSTGEARKSD